MGVLWRGDVPGCNLLLLEEQIPGEYSQAVILFEMQRYNPAAAVACFSSDDVIFLLFPPSLPPPAAPKRAEKCLWCVQTCSYRTNLKHSHGWWGMYGGGDPSTAQIVEFKRTFLKTGSVLSCPHTLTFSPPPPPALTVKQTALYVTGHLALRRPSISHPHTLRSPQPIEISVPRL